GYNNMDDEDGHGFNTEDGMAAAGSGSHGTGGSSGGKTGDATSAHAVKHVIQRLTLQKLLSTWDLMVRSNYVVPAEGLRACGLASSLLASSARTTLPTAAIPGGSSTTAAAGAGAGAASGAGSSSAATAAPSSAAAASASSSARADVDD